VSSAAGDRAWARYVATPGVDADEADEVVIADTGAWTVLSQSEPFDLAPDQSPAESRDAGNALV
jgi:hypothetical protein